MVVLVKRLVRPNRIPAVHLPLIPPLHKLGRRESGEALNAFERTEYTCLGGWEVPLAKAAPFLLLVGLTLSVQAGVREVGAIGLTVGDLDRELMFYTNMLPFELVSISETSGREQDALLGLRGVKLRVAMLKLGEERISLTEHLGRRGRPIPADSQSYDHWFQHIAIVVSDMDKAYERLHQHKVKQVSTAPQTLPAWNKSAAGIKAFYFRDPEDHVLEIIFFPPGKGDPKWQGSRRGNEAEFLAEQDESASSRRRLLGSEAPLFLGIDHTAMVVSDTETSLAFYRNRLGLRVVGESENYGEEQEHLNQVFGARLRITALRAPKGIGIEFLEYITPPGGRVLPADSKADDLVFWRTELLYSPVEELDSFLGDHALRFVSTKAADLPGRSASVILRDPDGHAVELRRQPPAESSGITSSSKRVLPRAGSK